jgi:hypothetical protein
MASNIEFFPNVIVNRFFKIMFKETGIRVDRFLFFVLQMHNSRKKGEAIPVTSHGGP